MNERVVPVQIVPAPWMPMPCGSKARCIAARPVPTGIAMASRAGCRIANAGKNQESAVDNALDETFPASDPISP